MGLTEGDVAASRGWILRLHGQLGAQGRSYRERSQRLAEQGEHNRRLGNREGCN